MRMLNAAVNEGVMNSNSMPWVSTSESPKLNPNEITSRKKNCLHLPLLQPPTKQPSGRSCSAVEPGCGTAMSVRCWYGGI